MARRCDAASRSGAAHAFHCRLRRHYFEVDGAAERHFALRQIILHPMLPCASARHTCPSDVMSLPVAAIANRHATGAPLMS